MNEIFKKAKKEYPKGSRFYTATGNVSTPLTVNELRVGENYPNSVFNEEGGCICYEDETTGEIVWAQKSL